MNQISIDTQKLKSIVPIIQYIKTFYKDKIVIEKESGGVSFAKCIFHKEDTASLAFYPNGTWKCFGCGEHGDLITLVQKIENVDFQSACIIIANNVGYQIDFINTNPAHEQYKDKLDELSRRYWRNLRHNPTALNYIMNDRRISQEMINEFRLGLTDNEEWKYRKDIGNISNRISFPILEHKRFNPKCVGMAYRSLGDDKPKYINDHNQDGRNGKDIALQGVFIKGNMLYGLAQAYKYISQSNFIFITEGYFDVISMHQSGFRNTVGIMGTSLTEEQMKTILKITKNVFFMLDGDNAGIIAMKKYIPEFIKYDAHISICILKDFKDPDEMCKHFNYDNNNIYNYLHNNLQDGIYYLIHDEIEAYHSLVLRERLNRFNKLYHIVNNIPNPAIKTVYLKEIERELF
jgi:DNA primase